MSNKLSLAFQKKNYMIIGVGLLLLIIGYTLMSGGGSEDPNQFNDDIFSHRRITLAPIVVILGYTTVLYGIMFRSKTNEQAQS